MIARDEIRQMSLQEKLSAMEAIWEELSLQEDRLEVPQWQKNLLDDRERLVQEGKASFIDWETAKKEIKRATHSRFFTP